MDGRNKTVALTLALSLIAALASGLWGTWADKVWPVQGRSEAEERPETGGPEGQDDEILKNSGYTAGYSDGLKNPRWVRYELDWDKRSQEKWKRPDVPFATDPRTRARVRTQDYTRSGFSRGHMAPSFAIGAFHGKEAQLETFLLSNIVPQNQACNDGVWNSIERMEADDFAKRFGKVVVVDGPVFGKEPPDRLPSGIAVPTAFFKLIIRPDGQTIAFIVPQYPDSPKPESYLASPAEIEAATGLGFGLPPEEAARKRTKIW